MVEYQVSSYSPSKQNKTKQKLYQTKLSEELKKKTASIFKQILSTLDF